MNISADPASDFFNFEECIRKISKICQFALDHHAKRGSAESAKGLETSSTDADRSNWGSLAGTIIESLADHQHRPQIVRCRLEELLAPICTAIKNVILLREDEVENKAKNTGQCAFPQQIYRNEGLHLVFRILYTLCRVCRYKTVLRLMPHEVSNLEPVLRLLESQDAQDYALWETRYMLLLWLSALLMVPFPLESIDSGSIAVETGDENSLYNALLSQCRKYLLDPGACREAAAVCLSRLLTRPDIAEQRFQQHLNWSLSQIDEVMIRRENRSADPTDRFLVDGVLYSLAEILKHGHRSNLSPHLSPLISRIGTIIGNSHSALERKRVVKLLQRAAINFLPPKVVSWRYERGKRSLLQTMPLVANISEWSKAKDPSEAAFRNINSPSTDAFERHVDIPSDVEDVLDSLLCRIRDVDSAVRWSVAKGIGRIAARLPMAMADDIIACVLELFDSSESHHAWHGGCLAIAELSRRGLLLPNRLREVVPLVCRALVYDVRRGESSVGSNVRDAACYVCWAFSRAYDPEIVAEYISVVAPQLLVISVFDRETNCRRAAAASFQENVGRLGHNSVPHGLEILAIVDFFSLAQRSHAYLEISVLVAQFEPYRRPLLDHLFRLKLCHWDSEIRKLSSQAFHKLVSYDPDYVASFILPELVPNTLSVDFVKRHGALLAIGEIITALAMIPYQLGEHVLKDLRNIVMRLEKARLYRGHGGEYIRAAVCKLIESICRAGHPLTYRAQKRLFESISESLRHPSDEVKNAAVAALQALSKDYLTSDVDEKVDGADALAGEHQGLWTTSTSVCVTEEQLKNFASPLLPQGMKPVCSSIVEMIVLRYCEPLERPDPNPDIRRGCALALGALQPGIIGYSMLTLTRIVEALVTACQIEDDVDIRDAETRRNAAISLGNVVETCGISVPNAPSDIIKTATLDIQTVSLIISALLAGCSDYDSDNRGDIGSFVRIASMKSLERVIQTLRTFGAQVFRATSGLLQTDLQTKTLGSVKLLRCVMAGGGNVCWVLRSDGPNLVMHKILKEDEIQKKIDFDTAVPALENLNECVAIDTEKFLTGKSFAGFYSSGNKSNGSKYSFRASICREYLSPEDCMSIFNALLIQLCDPIGHVREVAAGVIVRLLSSADSEEIGIPFVVKDLRQLKSLFLKNYTHNSPGDINAGVDWNNESAVYALVSNLLSIPVYLDSVLLGLTLAIGNRTERVSSSSGKALTEWCKGQKILSDHTNLSRLIKALSGILKSHSKSDRYVVSVLKTFDVLMTSEALIFPKSPAHRLSWAFDLLDMVAIDCRRSTNIEKLVASCRLFGGFCDLNNPARILALRCLVSMLGHKFPVVRTYAAKSFLLWSLSADPNDVCGIPEGESLSESRNSLAVNNNDNENGLIEFIREQARLDELALINRPDMQRPKASFSYDPVESFAQADALVGETNWARVTTHDARVVRSKVVSLLRLPSIETRKKAEGGPDSSIARNLMQKDTEGTYASLVHSNEMKGGIRK